MTSEQGSITVFMTFLFLLLFALVSVTLDSARFFGSRGFVKTCAYGADIALFGKYNRELFQEYGLLAYGGYGGKGAQKWQEEFEELISRNLMERPEEEEKDGLSKSYASVYRMGEMAVSLEDFTDLSDEEEFLRQVGEFLKNKVVREAMSTVLQEMPGGVSEKHRDLSQNVEVLVENKEQQEKEDKDDQSKGKSQTDEKGKPALGEKQASDGQAAGAALEKKENPLEFIHKLLRDGILSLVCDEQKLYEGEVAERNLSGHVEDREGKKEEWYEEASGVKILGKLLSQEEPLLQNVDLQSQGKKGKLVFYASQVFSCYTDDTDSSVPYGLEFLASGKRQQKDAFAAIVNRLFLIRTMLNYIYVESSPTLREESLVTATAIAGPLTAGTLISVLQQGILLVLALEEACVDITALLDGKCVPLVKNQDNFQMKYQEICTAGKRLFRKKASSYPSVSEEDRLGNVTHGMSYRQYLYLMQMLESCKKLCSRSQDLIQQDLRQRYNQTFTISQCISQTKVRVEYGIPLLTSPAVIDRPEGTASNSEQEEFIWQDVAISYGY